MKIAPNIVIYQFVWNMLGRWEKDNAEQRPLLGVHILFYAMSKLSLDYPYLFGNWEYYEMGGHIKCDELDIMLDGLDKISHQNTRCYDIRIPDIAFTEDPILAEAYGKFKEYLLEDISTDHLK